MASAIVDASATDTLPACACSMFGVPGLYCANDVTNTQPATCSLPFDVHNATELWKCTSPNIWSLQTDCATVAGSVMTCKTCPAGCPDACRLTNLANDTSCQTAAPTITQCAGM